MRIETIALKFCVGLVLGVPVIAIAQMEPHPHAKTSATILAASRDDSIFGGGISCCGRTESGTVVEEPVARLSADGTWLNITDCGPDNPAKCKEFHRDYLGKSHVFTVVSGEGWGATVRVQPTELGDCYDYNGTGTYTGANIINSAIAADSTEPFLYSPPLRPLHGADDRSILDSVSKTIPNGLDSRSHFEFFSFKLENQNLIVVQRTFANFGNESKAGPLQFIFAIGVMENGDFHVLFWKKNLEDENESALGTIRLQSGRDFLITSVSESESQFFRVYAIRDGKLMLVYSGGGSSC